jgi:hypothetical protein
MYRPRIRLTDWHENRAPLRSGQPGSFDVSKILAQDKAALSHSDSPFWGPIGQFHYWGEPLFGYYLSLW